MSKWFHSCRKGLLMGVACGLAMIALAGQTTRAGNIEIVITEDGLAPVMVQLGSGNEGPGTDMNHVVADTMALNAALDANGYDFHFNALGAIANSPGVNGLSFVDLTGLVFRVNTGSGGPGAQTIHVAASQNDFATQATLPGTLHNFVTANISNAPGGVQISTSFFNTSNGLNDTTGAISTVPLVYFSPGSAGSAPDVPVPSTAAFSLTGRADITLPGVFGTGTPATDQFTLHTQASAVPEPASVALMGIGLPVVIVGLGSLRRRRAAA